jgi:hypothetical protein
VGYSGASLLRDTVPSSVMAGLIIKLNRALMPMVAADPRSSAISEVGSVAGTGRGSGDDDAQGREGLGFDVVVLPEVSDVGAECQQVRDRRRTQTSCCNPPAQWA